MLLSYVHDLNPVILPITENLKVRWYGLAYLAGFILGWWVLKKLAEKKLFPLAPEKVSDFIAFGAFFGVFIGGRLGYVLFYMLPDPLGRQQIAEDPLTIIKVMDGGMSSHGGMLGLVIFAWFYSRRYQLSWPALGDGLVVVAPIGLFFGRVANFINGELFGTRADSLAWSVKFPGAVFSRACEESANYDAVMRVAIESSEGEMQAKLITAFDTGFGGEQALTAAVRASDLVKSAIEPFLYQRHPSQLYEAIVEGLLIFIILMGLRLRFAKLPNGFLTGLFFILYGAGRIFVEKFRVPDSELVWDIFTKGQFYSIFLLFAGAGFIIFSLKTNQKIAEKRG